jgi:hypothetical protein
MTRKHLLTLAFLSFAACGDEVETGKTFLALQSHFDGYTTWSSYALESKAPEGSLAHTDGDRFLFVNVDLSEKVDGKWPVGTIIVKEARNGDDKTQWEIHAMAKRGGNYNRSGAVGWEWFDLAYRSNDDATPVIKTRGLGTGENYGGLSPSAPGVDCNTCHVNAADLDFVQSPALNPAR